MSSFVVDVEGMEAEGDGAAYARVNGRRVLVDFAIPGERVEVRLADGAGDDATAEVAKVIRRSEHRIDPPCPHFGPCGGCMWQHIAYAEQLRLKERMLQALMRQRLGARAPRVEPVATVAGDPWGYRGKAHFVFAPVSRAGGLVMGHYRRHAMSVVPTTECRVHDVEGNRVAFALKDALAEGKVDGAVPGGGRTRSRGLARHVVVRATRSPAETLATLVVLRNDKSLRPVVRALVAGPRPPDGLHLNVHDRPGPYLFGRETLKLHGRDRVRETLAGVSFLISPTAFFQTNVRAADLMVSIVLEHACEARTALDLYAGAGLFALPLATRGVNVTAVEENREAVEDGERSREFNRIAASTCRFVCTRAEELTSDVGRRGIRQSPDLVILDPPRAGCPPAVLSWICRTLKPARVIYVSCHPEALAEDLAIPLDAGYSASRIQPLDMFPHTPHIETVAVLDRSGR